MHPQLEALVNRIAPNKRLALIISAAGIAVAALVYFLLIAPQTEKNTALRESIDSLSSRSATMKRLIAKCDAFEKDYTAMQTQMTDFADQGLITPLLNSYAMRVKSFLDPLAKKAKISAIQTSECQQITLPIPPKTTIPEQLYIRQPITCQGEGSFLDLIVFIEAIEARYALATITGIKITIKEDNPEVQSFTLTIEWPCKGPSTKPPAKKKK